MAVLDMKLYDDLQKNVESAKRNNEQYTVQMTKIKKDLKKRKNGRKARIVMLCVCALVLIVSLLVGLEVISFGGSQSAMPPEGEPIAPPEDTGVDLILLGGLLTEAFVACTWLLCWVGFPIGWNSTKKERQDAKNQLYVQHTVREDGSIDTYASTWPARIGAFLFSLFLGALTMVASLPIAVVQCFTWKKHIKKIESLVAEIQGNPLFVCE